jgi:hypothetical protein
MTDEIGIVVESEFPKNNDKSYSPLSLSMIEVTVSTDSVLLFIIFGSKT